MAGTSVLLSCKITPHLLFALIHELYEVARIAIIISSLQTGKQTLVKYTVPKIGFKSTSKDISQ